MEAIERERLEGEVALRQLERMRSMQYAYHQKFFSWITLVFVLLAALWVFGGSAGLWLMPFVVVTAGVQAAFYLHFCDFARVHAAAFERRINGLLGERVLRGSELESDYFYPLPAPKVAGFVPSRPFSFFSVYTLHWCVLWAGVFTVSLYRLWAGQPGPWTRVVVGVALVWAVANAGYVAWFFLRGDSVRRMARSLE
ncbi:MAG: hypothetical protein SFU85_06305 [Candidatus Methylacidiphilales bacterium]|nr:hypothetical protein [Candidatus Methylacidiphilales bacterium]